MKTQKVCMFCFRSFAATKRNQKRCNRCKADEGLPMNQELGRRVRLFGAFRRAVGEVRAMVENIENEA